VPGVVLSLAGMQALYAGVSNPPAEYSLRSQDIRGEMFELFDKEFVLGVFQVPGKPGVREASTILQVLAPTSRLKVAWTIDGASAETWTFDRPPGNGSAYRPPVHAATISVELLELDGVACSRKAELRIR